MGIDLSTQKSIFSGLREHAGHNIVLFGYRKNADTANPIVNMSIECMTCGCVLIDADAPNENFICPAEIHRDDFKVQHDFEAEFFFRSASDDEILALFACGWRGDAPADEVAHVCSFLDHGIDEVLDNCSQEEGMGFEVSVDREKALRYLWKRRPSLMLDIELEGEYDVPCIEESNI